MAHCSVRGLALLAAVGAVTSSAQAVTITDNNVTDISAVIGGLTALDLSSVIAVTPGTNTVVSNFSNGAFFGGTLTASVYGNVGAPGTGLTDVVIVYEFVTNAGFTPIETFTFGVDSGSNIDFLDIQNATQGSVTNSTTAGQSSPFVSLTDNSALLTNDTLAFDFASAGDSLANGETLTWYMQTGGDVAINFVDVNITDFGGTLSQTLAFITGTGQPDMNVPAPGSVWRLAMGLGVATRRRRA